MVEFVDGAGSALRWAGYLSLPLLLLPVLVLIAPRLAGRTGHSVTALIDRITGLALWAAIFAAFAIILIQLAAVILRYVFGLSFSWLNDSVIFSFAMIFMLGAAGTLRNDGHVRVDILRGKFGPKTQALIELVGSLLFIVPIGVLILYAGSGMIARSWVGLEPFNESDGLPVKFLFKTLVPAFAILMIGQAISQAIKAALAIRGVQVEDGIPQQPRGAL